MCLYVRCHTFKLFLAFNGEVLIGLVEVFITLSFNDLVARTRIRFEAPAVKNGDRSPAVMNPACTMAINDQ